MVNEAMADESITDKPAADWPIAAKVPHSTVEAAHATVETAHASAPMTAERHRVGRKVGSSTNGNTSNQRDDGPTHHDSHS